jgi:hypothetical protein
LPDSENFTLVYGHCLRTVTQRMGVTTISRSAAIRSSKGGCVLNKELKLAVPNRGWTIQSDEVLGEMAEVGMRRLYVPSFSSALIRPC